MEKDTQGMSGSPDIAHTVFDKISNSQIFVGDVSIINSNDRNSDGQRTKRLTPNPSVLVELGFAARHLDWDKIISVFNTAYGAIEDLPFDIRQRRTLTYKANEEERDKKLLISKLKEAIQAIINHSEILNINSRTRVIQLLINELEYNRYVCLKMDGSNFSTFEVEGFSQATEQGLRSLINDETVEKIREIYFLFRQLNMLIEKLDYSRDNYFQTTRILEIAKDQLPPKIKNVLTDLQVSE